MPQGNSPITNVGSKDFICNANPKPASGKCGVNAGSTVTVEMHQVRAFLSPFNSCSLGSDRRD